MAEVLEKDDVSLRICFPSRPTDDLPLGPGICEHDGRQAQHDFDHFA